MNSYMQMQVNNMRAMVKTFEQSCELAARKDDGQVDPAEAKNIKKIKAAVAKFTKELETLK